MICNLACIVLSCVVVNLYLGASDCIILRAYCAVLGCFGPHTATTQPCAMQYKPVAELEFRLQLEADSEPGPGLWRGPDLQPQFGSRLKLGLRSESEPGPDPGPTLFN